MVNKVIILKIYLVNVATDFVMCNSKYEQLGNALRISHSRRKKIEEEPHLELFKNSENTFFFDLFVF